MQMQQTPSKLGPDSLAQFDATRVSPAVSLFAKSQGELTQEQSA
jgi:hypothetical protein